VGNFPLAVEFLNKANLLQPNNYDILFKLGTALYQTKKLDEAHQIFENLRSLAPNSAETFYYLGLIAFDQNSDEIAVQNFENALALKPNFADANFMLGELMSKHLNYTNAKGFYEKAIQIDNSKPAYFIRLGGTYLYLKDFLKSLAIFRDASERFPQIADIQYFLAIAERINGNFELALNSVKKAILLKPNYADALALTGAILFDKNKLVEAEKYLRQAIAYSSNNFNAHNDLGRLLVKQQRFSEAVPLLQRARQISPNNPDVHYQLFLAFSRLKRKTEADQELALCRNFMKSS
jgi:tetratricopeptide (TPR) repeat protein